jgi:hypothetical protein
MKQRAPLALVLCLLLTLVAPWPPRAAHAAATAVPRAAGTRPETGAAGEGGSSSRTGSGRVPKANGAEAQVVEALRDFWATVRQPLGLRGPLLELLQPKELESLGLGAAPLQWQWPTAAAKSGGGAAAHNSSGGAAGEAAGDGSSGGGSADGHGSATGDGSGTSPFESALRDLLGKLLSGDLPSGLGDAAAAARDQVTRQGPGRRRRLQQGIWSDSGSNSLGADGEEEVLDTETLQYVQSIQASLEELVGLVDRDGSNYAGGSSSSSSSSSSSGGGGGKSRHPHGGSGIHGNGNEGPSAHSSSGEQAPSRARGRQLWQAEDNSGPSSDQQAEDTATGDAVPPDGEQGADSPTRRRTANAFNLVFSNLFDFLLQGGM